MTGVKIIEPGVFDPKGFRLSMDRLQEASLSLMDQIPTIGRIRDQIERAKEEGIQKCIAQFGMSMDRPEEIRERCTIVVMLHAQRGLLQVDGIPILEWGYLDPKCPNVWTMRSVESVEK